MQVKVYAKLNLTLNVSGVYNGFHIIDSVATSVDIFDTVEVAVRADGIVTVAGLPQIPAEQNVSYKAACVFKERFGLPCGYDITVAKGIPMGAGMGGSSADAAAVIYALCKLNDIDVNCQDVRNLCAELGSDVNYMLHGGLARLRGKGDDVVYAKLGSPLYFALTVFNTPMSTAEVYSQFDKLDADQAHIDNGSLFEILQNRLPRGVTECFNNHLQVSAESLSDYASAYLQFCKDQGLTSNMTGSGSAYYIACDSKQSAKQAADLLSSNGFKTVVCKSVNKGIEVISN